MWCCHHALKRDRKGKEGGQRRGEGKGRGKSTVDATMTCIQLHPNMRNLPNLAQLSHAILPRSVHKKVGHCAHILLSKGFST
jgi:hypothetical protein